MADGNACYSFVLGNEDWTPPRYEVMPDPTRDDPDAKVVSGINSASFPDDFATIAALPPAERPAAVEALYKQTYWNQWIEQLQTPIAMRVMDSEVNQGQGTAVKLLQTACKAVLRAGAEQLATDGLLGPATVAAANACDQDALLMAFQAARVAEYRAIGGPALPQWIARAEK